MLHIWEKVMQMGQDLIFSWYKSSQRHFVQIKFKISDLISLRLWVIPLFNPTENGLFFFHIIVSSKAFPTTKPKSKIVLPPLFFPPLNFGFGSPLFFWFPPLLFNIQFFPYPKFSTYIQLVCTNGPLTQ